MISDIFAARLHELRVSQKLTLQNVGDAIGSTRQTIGNLEKMQKSPSLDMIISLADYFDVSIDYLVGRSDIAERR